MLQLNDFLAIFWVKNRLLNIEGLIINKHFYCMNTQQDFNRNSLRVLKRLLFKRICIANRLYAYIILRCKNK